MIHRGLRWNKGLNRTTFPAELSGIALNRSVPSRATFSAICPSIVPSPAPDLSSEGTTHSREPPRKASLLWCLFPSAMRRRPLRSKLMKPRHPDEPHEHGSRPGSFS